MLYPATIHTEEEQYDKDKSGSQSKAVEIDWPCSKNGCNCLCMIVLQWCSEGRRKVGRP